MSGHDFPDDGQAEARAFAVAGLKRLNDLVRGAAWEPCAVVVDRNAAAAQIGRDALRAMRVDSRAKSKLGSGRNVQGIGFAEYRTLLASYGLIHALYEVRVIDGKTFDVIEKRVASPLGNIETMRLQGPSQLVDGSFDGPAGIETLRAAIVDLVTRSLAQTLGDMAVHWKTMLRCWGKQITSSPPAGSALHPATPESAFGITLHKILTRS